MKNDYTKNFYTAKPYMNMKALGAMFDRSQPYLRKIVEEVKREISEGRYPEYVISGNRFNLYAIIDYMTYRDMLRDNALRKRVPPFDPIPIARLCGQEGVKI